MKFVIPTFERIEWMPPTITLFQKMIKSGHEIVYITIYPDNYFAQQELKGIRNVYLCKKERSIQRKFPYIKGISGILFRIDNLIKRIISLKLKDTIAKEMSKDSILWVVNEMTVMLAGSRFLKNYHYMFTLYELHENKFKNRNIASAIKNADTVVVPEFCRANILKVWFGLDSLPVVIPNKSDNIFNEQVTEKAGKAIEKIKKLHEEGKILILYMGGIVLERPLEPILNAIKDSNKYRLVIIGRKSFYLNELLKNYKDEIVYLGSFVPPEHLQVAMWCDIGHLIYIPLNSTEQGLNVLFCAPNKIFEYTGCGMPVITNDIPALRFDVKSNHIGEVVNFDKPEAVIRSLENLCDNYKMYSDNAKKFYNSVNIDALIESAITDFLSKQDR